MCAMAGACHARAAAAIEFCPARITKIYSKPKASDATTYYYQLQALASRVVEGNIIADTDAGWFAWVQQPVQLTRTTYVSESRSMKLWYRVAESPELTVVFPQPVAIRHAWIAIAQTHGDHFFNWDARGRVTCEPPDFGVSKYPNTTKEVRSPVPGDETPAPAPPPANAAASVMPFVVANCAKPFVSATVTDPAEPEFPASLKEVGFGGTATSEIAVAIDQHGNLVDAWVWAKSGYPGFDDSALRAARRSSYTGAISYCRPISATYLFRADFMSP
jgi:hypothetical protein